MWGMHAGKHGDIDQVFLNEQRVAVGWFELGALSALPASRDAFKAHIASTYPDKSAAAVANWAGQLFRFVHEMQIGDLVVYRSRHPRQINIGRISGPYKHDPTPGEQYPNQRRTEWLRSWPVAAFSQGALYEIGSAMSLFQVKTYLDEFRAALAEKAAAPKPSATLDDESVPLVVEQTEENTRDFVQKLLLQHLKGHPFADFVAQLLRTMGYRTRVSEEGPDGGVDIVAHRDELGFDPPLVRVQVKSTAGNTGDPDLSAFVGKVAHTEFGLFVTLGSFTAQAQKYARTQSNLRIIDGDGLVGLVLDHYDQLDARYKGLIPLKRIFVPDPDEP